MRQQIREGSGRMPGFGSLFGALSGETAARMPLELTPAYALWDTVSRNLSPYDLNKGRITFRHLENRGAPGARPPQRTFR